MFNKKLVLILLIGIILRIIIIGSTYLYRENTDILRFKDWTRITFLYSLADSYTPQHLTFGTYPNNVPPGTTYAFYGPYFLWLNTGRILTKILQIQPGSNIWINGPLLTLFLRMPAFICDITIFGLIYWLVNKYKSAKIALISASIYLFNPVILFNSAYMGQIDSVNNLFFIACLIAVLSKRYILAMILIALSLNVKLSLIYQIPFLLYLLYLGQSQVTGFISSIVTLLSTSVALLLPVSTNPIHWYLQFLSHNLTGEMPNITAYAFNFWWMVFRPKVTLGSFNSLYSASEITLENSPNVSVLFWGIPLSLWTVAIFILSTIPLLLMLYRKHRKILLPENLFLFFSIIALLSFLFLPKMHDRYMYPAIVLLAVAAGFRKKLIKYLLILSGLNFINLLVIWHPTPFSYSWYLMMNSIWLQWIVSLITVIGSLCFYRESYKVLSRI
jgi:Gpi18-like mannosyltransferase